MKRYLIALFIFFAFSGMAQTGPGGVGTADGSSSLVLWLDANTVSGTNGATVTTWLDQSGNGHDFSDGNGAVYNESVVNGYPAFSFNGYSHYFQKPFTAAITPESFSIFTVTNVTSTSRFKAVVSNRDDPAGSPTAGFILYSRPNTNKWDFWTGRSSGAWQRTYSDVSTAGTWAGQEMNYENSPSGKNIRIKGELRATNTHSMTSNTKRPFRIGSGRNEQTNPDYYYKGDMSEIILFDRVLNAAQRIIVNNYLSAKYNYALIVDDLYGQDDNGNGDYDHDVAGIGQASDGSNHTDAQGTGKVRVLNADDLNNNEFLFWGNDGRAISTSGVTDFPSEMNARVERVWRVSEVDDANNPVDVGSIEMRFDLSDLGAVNAIDLRLLVDTDNDGEFADETPIAGASSVGGNVYAFAGVTAIADGFRFTVGTVEPEPELPVELVDFQVSVKDNDKVIITWLTASEKNSDYFAIERSDDAKDWNIIGSIEAAGETTATNTYDFIDESPANGVNYYRLKQVDFDGEVFFSMIKNVNLRVLPNTIFSVYPNPATTQIRVNGVFDSPQNVRVYSAIGQDVTIFTTIDDFCENGIVIGVTNLTNGLYFISTQNTSLMIIKR